MLVLAKEHNFFFLILGDIVACWLGSSLELLSSAHYCKKTMQWAKKKFFFEMK